MAMTRCVVPEILDYLPSDDSQARRSRRDLQRVNALMGHPLIFARAVRAAALPPPRRIVEIGAGDGTLMVSLARRWAVRWPAVEVLLLDRLEIVEPATLAAFRALGWRAQPVVADVFDWLRRSDSPAADLMLANLFLHHFPAEQLAGLLALAAARCRTFIACEPRRSTLSLLGSHLLGLIGCNAVTRHDAVISVRAGFKGRELSSLWPAADGRRLREWPAGVFSHGFLAQYHA